MQVLVMPEEESMGKIDYVDRFWGYVAKSPLPNGCWLWTAGTFNRKLAISFAVTHGDYSEHQNRLH